MQEKKSFFERTHEQYHNANQKLKSPFCTTRSLPTYEGVRVFWDDTIIPIVNIQGELIAYQRLKTDPNAKFGMLTAGKSKGGMIVIHNKKVLTTLPDPEMGQVAFCEGFHTGSLIHKTTGITVFCCLSLATVSNRIWELIEYYGSHIINISTATLYAEFRSSEEHLYQSLDIAETIGINFSEAFLK